MCFNVTAGIGVLAVARYDDRIFGSSLPDVVDGAFAATYVLMISLFNMAGRFAWASFSDHLGAATRTLCSSAWGWRCICDSVDRRAGGRFAQRGLAGGVLRRHHVDLHHVRRRLRDHPAYWPTCSELGVGAIRPAARPGRAGILGPWVLTELRERAWRAIEELAARFRRRPSPSIRRPPGNCRCWFARRP